VVEGRRSTETGVYSTEGGVVFSVESAGEEPLGEGTGVVDLDGSRDIISKGFVFTWDDGSIVGRRGGRRGKEGRGKGRRRGGERETGGLMEYHSRQGSKTPVVK